MELLSGYCFLLSAHTVNVCSVWISEQKLLFPLLAQPLFTVVCFTPFCFNGRSQWPRGLRRKSRACRLLILWVRIPPGAWMSGCCECCVLSDRGLCDELTTRPEESYRLWCVAVCDIEASSMMSQTSVNCD